jgi:hypothetical protein
MTPDIVIAVGALVIALIALFRSRKASKPTEPRGCNAILGYRDVYFPELGTKRTSTLRCPTLAEPSCVGHFCGAHCDNLCHSECKHRTVKEFVS